MFTPALGHTQTTALQRLDQLAALDKARAGTDDVGVELGRHVVVVALERPLGDAGPGREGVQLAQLGVAHQVGPQPPVRRPARQVDEQSHRRSVRRPTTVRRPTELATIAVGRLATRLAELPSFSGGLQAGAYRVNVAVTTPDGTRIEMSTQVDGSGD